MILPSTFKTTIENTFYDKVITRYSSSPVKETNGWTRKGNLAVTGTFKGNVNFSKLAQIQEDYGITDKIDIAITTSATVIRDEIIGYDGLLYKVLEAPKSDSHTLLIAQKWSSKLTTSISA